MRTIPHKFRRYCFSASGVALGSVLSLGCLRNFLTVVAVSSLELASPLFFLEAEDSLSVVISVWRRGETGVIPDFGLPAAESPGFV